MNYEKLYFKFIKHFQQQEIEPGTYTERHHIIPRYAGGSDDESNLVTLTYKQHTFVHKLWWKYTKDTQAELAYKMMSGIEQKSRRAFASYAGRCATEKGILDRIRPLANTPVRQEKLKQLHLRRKEDEDFAKVWHENISKGKKGKKHSEKSKEAFRQAQLKRYQNPREVDKAKEFLSRGREKTREKSLARQQEILGNAERNEEYLHMTSSRSKSKFVSPEGLVFDSPIFAAKYYGGNAYGTLIEKWCKTKINGWYTIPKTE